MYVNRVENLFGLNVIVLQMDVNIVNFSLHHNFKSKHKKLNFEPNLQRDRGIPCIYESIFSLDFLIECNLDSDSRLHTCCCLHINHGSNMLQKHFSTLELFFLV